MNIAFNFKNFEPSDHLKEYARGRFEKLLKYSGGRAEEHAEVQVNMAVEKFRHMAEVIFVEDDLHLSASHESADMYSTIDLVLDKIESQLKRLREKIKERRRSGRQNSVRMDVISFAGGASSGNQPTIVATDRYEPKPMNLDEAAMQLQNRDDFEFLVFHNSETDRINVIYRRKNGDFGLIDPGT